MTESDVKTATLAAGRIAYSRLGRNTLSMLLGHVGKILSQALFFILLARSLGSAAFGVFSATVAVAAIVAPLTSVGAVPALVRRVAKQPTSAAAELAGALSVMAATGAVASIALVCFAPALLPQAASLEVVALVSSADLVFLRCSEACAAAYQALGRMRVAAFSLVSVQAMRAITALVLVSGWPAAGPDAWAVAYFSSTALICLSLIALSSRDIGLAPIAMGEIKSRWREGFLFAVGLSAQSVYNDIDKAMLGKISGPEPVGAYSAGYRIVDTAFTPVRALLSAAYPRFFVAGADSLSACLKLGCLLSVPVLLYSSAMALLLLATAPLMPALLGNSFASSVNVVRWLSVLPLLKGLQYLAADALTGAGLQGRRTLAQLCICLLNVVANVLLMPQFGLSGAVATSLASDLVLMVAAWAILLFAASRASIDPRPPVTSPHLDAVAS